VAGSDRRLQLVLAGTAEGEGGVEAGGCGRDPGVVPAGAVLDVERHDVAERVDAPGAPGVVQLHQRQQALDLRLAG
jgi:hypothetical protein